MTVNDSRQGVLHLLPSKSKRVQKLVKGVSYTEKTRMHGRRTAVSFAKQLGHDMTRFSYSVDYDAVQSKCRKCRLMLQDFNFSIHGPALEYECGTPQPGIKIVEKAK
jgi:hypothetical protein